MAIKKDGLIEKRNVLNEVRNNNMTLQEIRFFSIYLSKINARDISSRKVTFSLEDFQKIMNFGRLNIRQLESTTDSLLRKIVKVRDGNGGYTAFQLFKRCKVFKSDDEQWYIEIDAHDDALPLMFEFKKEYFTYELWNALRLKSSNQLRMYEILKQYETIGKRKLSLKELRELLGISSNEYPRWDRFRDRVLDVCQKALAENTDITFTYRPIKSGRGGKITEIEFTISKNENYTDQLTLNEFIDIQSNKEIPTEIEEEPEEYHSGKKYSNEMIDFLADACHYEFSEKEMDVLFFLIANKRIPESINGTACARFEYLSRKYAELEWRASQRPIKNRFGYLKKLIETDGL